MNIGCSLCILNHISFIRYVIYKHFLPIWGLSFHPLHLFMSSFSAQLLHIHDQIYILEFRFYSILHGIFLIKFFNLGCYKYLDMQLTFYILILHPVNSIIISNSCVSIDIINFPNRKFKRVLFFPLQAKYPLFLFLALLWCLEPQVE